MNDLLGLRIVGGVLWSVLWFCLMMKIEEFLNGEV